MLSPVTLPVSLPVMTAASFTPVMVMVTVCSVPSTGTVKVQIAQVLHLAVVDLGSRRRPGDGRVPSAPVGVPLPARNLASFGHAQVPVSVRVGVLASVTLPVSLP